MVSRKRGAKKTKKSVAPRKASHALNQRRLQEDIAYYEEHYFDDRRRTAPTIKHPRGVQLKNLQFRNGRYVSGDGDISISQDEYERYALNPNAVPRYIRIKGTNKFYNTQTGHVVSAYYRYQIFGKEFNKVDTEEQVMRATAYAEAIKIQNARNRARQYDLIDSYVLRHPEFKTEYGQKGYRAAVAKDPNFIRLTSELQSFNYKRYGITIENIEMIDEILGGSYDVGTAEQEKGLLIAQLGEDPRYQEVLVELGRRLPEETRPIGSYGPGYIKSFVVPYYQAVAK